MRRLQPLAIVLVLALAGCKSREAQVPGTWSGGGVSMEFKEDKTWSMAAGPATLAGKWTFASDVVTATPETLNGSPVADAKREAQKMLDANPMFANAGKAILDELDKPKQLTLSKDAKSLTGQFQGKPVTLTKPE